MIHLFYDKKTPQNKNNIASNTTPPPKKKKPTKKQHKLKEFENDYCTLKTECMCVNIKC